MRYQRDMMPNTSHCLRHRGPVQPRRVANSRMTPDARHTPVSNCSANRTVPRRMLPGRIIERHHRLARSRLSVVCRAAQCRAATDQIAYRQIPRQDHDPAQQHKQEQSRWADGQARVIVLNGDATGIPCNPCGRQHRDKRHPREARMLDQGPQNPRPQSVMSRTSQMLTLARAMRKSPIQQLGGGLTLCA